MYEVIAFDGFNNEEVILCIEDTEEDACYLAREYSISFGAGWRVYVHNEKGICFEVTENCKKGIAKILFQNYLESLKIDTDRFNDKCAEMHKQLYGTNK